MREIEGSFEAGVFLFGRLQTSQRKSAQSYSTLDGLDKTRSIGSVNSLLFSFIMFMIPQFTRLNCIRKKRES